ncbi:Glucan endo-1,3-beta-glucosidase 4 [Acorus calamus]|uniref:Glucan endo-1,3-beta-glucosidase 4 n=1 Tax=Acorus calamus TaxID=4465 RepID=A0AAV9EE18_ACOCL|nr:Glucan endo-1,3-beta-glucosidase 4 [Acorus calamus]
MWFLSTKITLSLALFLLIQPKTDGQVQCKEWCIADPQTPEDILQAALNWACGPGGADCGLIQQNQPCYLPNKLVDHASYAFNSYWQKYKHKGGTCDFSSAAMVVGLDPSHDHCTYDSVS